jgi:hypothetical protein
MSLVGIDAGGTRTYISSRIAAAASRRKPVNRRESPVRGEARVEKGLSIASVARSGAVSRRPCSVLAWPASNRPSSAENVFTIFCAH